MLAAEHSKAYYTLLIGKPNRRFGVTFQYFYNLFGKRDEREIEVNRDQKTTVEHTTRIPIPKSTLPRWNQLCSVCQATHRPVASRAEVVTAPAAMVGLALKPITMKKAIFQFVNPSNALCHARLDAGLNHLRAKSSKVKIEKKADGTTHQCQDRGRCVVCCEKCDRHSNHFGNKCSGRVGRKPSHYCVVCKVYLCDMCWVSFHCHDIPCLPPCTERKLGLVPQRVLRFGGNQPQAASPVRAMIQTRRNIESLPTRAGITPKIIGERIRQSAARAPDSPS
jgi:hypothetical protein